MESQQQRRVEHYLINADHFLWGLTPGNQQKTYEWLEKQMGFHFTKAKYGLVIQQLLRDPGVEVVLKRLVVLGVAARFPAETLDALRRLWNLGELPDLKKDLSVLTVNGEGYAGPDRGFHWRPFVEINTQFHYVERWGNLAGVWFEEIEPWMREEHFQYPE